MEYVEKIYTLNEIKQCITQIIGNDYPEIKKVGLFGSYARNEAHAMSDLDLMIIEPSCIRGMVMWSLSGDIKEALKKPVDIFRLDSVDTDSCFYENLEKEMVIIYDNSNNE